MKKYNNDHEHQNFTKFTIVVPTEEDRNELMECSEYLHDNFDVDTDNIVVNQLIHQYLDQHRGSLPNNIIVNEELYNKIKVDN